MINFEDLLSPLEKEHLESLFSLERQRIRGAKASFFKMTIPLEATASKKQVRALKVRPLTDNANKIIVGLLWNRLFGRKFKLYHWYILHELFLRTLNKDKQSLVLLKLLVIRSSSEHETWKSSLKPIKTCLYQRMTEERAKKELTTILEHLPYTLPQKGPKISNLLTVENGSIVQKKPRELVSVGKGYKDQGSLGGMSLEPLSPELFVEKGNIFKILFRQVKKELPEFFK